MERKDFSYTYNARGYMLTYKGVSIGGVGIAKDARAPRGRAAQNQVRDYARNAEADIANIINGNWGHYGTALASIEQYGTAKPF